ncbi:MAG: bifunctional demethylmenaquinone methyltransferase/2-methoxy-6-polyprenyl-1,4-benzoquinol methylase UbiE [Bacteroidota bacterium]
MMITPYGDKSTGKKTQVAQMFDNIAPKYDFLNHFLSLGIDILWRKKAVRMLRKDQPKLVLDIATGTGDFAIEALSMQPDRIIGVDISREMIAMGDKKLHRKGLDDRITLQLGDSENLEFPDNHFDAITIAFGVRNFEHLEKGLAEMQRVLKPGAKAAIIEFSRPRRFPVKQLYFFYFTRVLPFIGRLVSKDPRAYTYLPESVRAFPDGQDFLDKLKEAGFRELSITPLSFGIASIYLAGK